jgi:polar amino acid transport system permease protein
VLPQALRRMLPPTASQFIQTMKDSALASTIGFRELTRRVSELQNQTYKPLELYTFLAIEYLIIIIFLSYLVRVMERRIAID